MPRPPPRWAKWSRGVRTRGLRVGLVGGPRPLSFLTPWLLEGQTRFALPIEVLEPLTFKGSGIIYGTEDEPPAYRS